MGCGVRRFVLLSLFVVGHLGSVVAPIAAAPTTVLRPPVDAPVLDPFRLPAGRYAAGNRGIEYRTDPGDFLVSAGPGVVVFAGPVAGSTWITIDHGGGLKTAYGPLQTLDVGRGDVVRRGERLATTAGVLHFSARVDGTYVDPAPLFGELVVDVRLVPHETNDDPALAAAAERAERLALFDLLQHRSGSGGGIMSSIGQWVTGVARNTMPDEVVAGLLHSLDVALTVGAELSPEALAAELISGLVAVLDPAPCSGAGAAAAAAPAVSRRRIAIVVDGLGSTSTVDGIAGDLELERFGYAADDVVRFSYAGGLTPSGGESWSESPPRTGYAAAETGRPVAQSVAALADVLRQVRAANPDAEIDLFGHSLGGVLARLAAAETEPEVDLSVVMTFASPHAGAPLASVVDAALSTTPGMIVREGLDAFDPDSPLRVPSLADLSEAGHVGTTADIAFPEGVHAVTIGHRADVIVPGTEAGAPGARHVIVGGFDPRGAHGDIGLLPEVHNEIRLALAGLPPACQGASDAIFDLVTGMTVATVERGAAGAIVAADLRTGGVAVPSR